MNNSDNKNIESPFRQPKVATEGQGQIKKHTWILPSKEDGQAFVIRTQAAEKDLCAALDMLDHVKESIPHTPASQTKTDIEQFLARFKKSNG